MDELPEQVNARQRKRGRWLKDKRRRKVAEILAVSHVPSKPSWTCWTLTQPQAKEQTPPASQEPN